MGSPVKGGLIGNAPDLKLESNKDLQFSTDFRRVYHTVLDRWLAADAEKILGSAYEPLPLV